MRVAYLINQYPIISTTFIRREILALERQGVQIKRIALRGWDNRVMDTEDEHEQARTSYVLQAGLVGLLLATVRVFLASPLRFVSAFCLAIKMGWHADRPLPYHFAYLAEACLALTWLKKWGATHVHTHFGTNAAEVVMLVRALGGPPYSITVHGPVEFDKPTFLAIAEKVRRSAFVVAITSFARSQLYRWVDHSCWEKIKVIHCGLEPAFYQDIQYRHVDAPRLVCVARLSAEKGQLLLVEAANRLAAKGVAFQLVLVGDGDMRDEIKALIGRYGLGKHIRMTGSISTERLKEEILMARGLILPSFAEGLPMVLMEAMALQRPVLCSSLAGIPELVRDAKEGRLFPPGSIEALCEAIEAFLALSPEQLRAMSEAAYDRVRNRHSVDEQASRLAALFRRSAVSLDAGL